MRLFSKAEFTCEACEVYVTGLESYEAYRLAELHVHPTDYPPDLPEEHPTDQKEG